MCADELLIIDACTVIDFCGRTDNLNLLLLHVDRRGVITSAVHGELVRQQRKRFSILSSFLVEVDAGVVRVVDPPLDDPNAERILATWDGIFGPGEVSSVALAVAKRWIFVSRDREPMREFAQRETIMIQSTEDVLNSLVRRGAISKIKAADILKEISRANRRR